MMKYKLALELVELDMLAVQFRSDVGLPLFRNLCELIGNVDFVHTPVPPRTPRIFSAPLRAKPF